METNDTNMGENSSLRLGAILSALGVAFGWFLNQLGVWWRVRREDKRTLKKVLHNLLEVHHLLGRFDNKKTIEEVVEKITKDIPPKVNTKEFRNELNALVEEMIFEFLGKVTVQDLKQLEQKYELAIAELSQIDPIRSYYLSDKVKVLEKINLIEDWVSNTSDKYSVSENEKKKTQKEISDSLSPSILGETLNELKSELKAIAWKIGLITWLRIRNLLNPNNYKEDELESKIKSFLDQALKSHLGSFGSLI